MSYYSSDNLLQNVLRNGIKFEKISGNKSFILSPRSGGWEISCTKNNCSATDMLKGIIAGFHILRNEEWHRIKKEECIGRCVVTLDESSFKIVVPEVFDFNGKKLETRSGFFVYEFNDKRASSITYPFILGSAVFVHLVDFLHDYMQIKLRVNKKVWRVSYLEQ